MSVLFEHTSRIVLCMLVSICSAMFMLRSDTMWYTTGKVSIYQAIAALILVLWLVQVLTGLVLITLIAYVFDVSWDHLMFVVRSNRYI